ncbi:MAG: Rrf2 family transcriptional regulator [Pseudorhodoplanes sp.]|nr:Rrf2 family transcriptional regulator [Pseudorhodoplanes sp.]
MLLSRKGILAVAAVIDVALHGQDRPVSAKALAGRHQLPPRHLEPVLQALVHDGILKGVRGPRGGYELGREQNEITADQILRAAGSSDNGLAQDFPTSEIVNGVVLPAVVEAERAFGAALGMINIEDLVRLAQARAPAKKV